MRLKQLFFGLLLFLCSSPFVFGQSKDSSNTKVHFELSFGQSLLFLSNTKLSVIRNTARIVVPTNAILFFASFRPEKLIRIPVFFNLPTESKQFLINGQLIYERASPTFGSGLEFRCFKAKLDAKSKIECEVGPLVSLIFNRSNQISLAPIVAGRIRISRGDNFVMYLGGSYSFGINAFGLLYGTGTVF